MTAVVHTLTAKNGQNIPYLLLFCMVRDSAKMGHASGSVSGRSHAYQTHLSKMIEKSISIDRIRVSLTKG